MALAFDEPAGLPGCTVTAHELTCSGVDIPAGESIEHRLLVRLAPAYAGDGSDLADDADIFSWTPDPVLSNNTRNSTLPGLGVGPRKVDLTASVTPPGDGVTPGTVDTMTMTAENLGPSTTAGRGRAVLRLPGSITAVRRSLPDGCTTGESNAVVRCRVPKGLLSGEEHEWRLRIEVAPEPPAGDRFTGGHARVGDPADPNAANDRVGFAVRAQRPAADLVMAKRPVSDRPVRPGETFGYRLTVTNSGPSNARNVVVRDRLPRPLSFTSSLHGCTARGDRVGCPTIERLRAGETRSFVVFVELDSGYRGDGRNVANRAVVSSDVGDLDETNNSSELRTSGVPGGVVTHPPADLSVSVRTSSGSSLESLESSVEPGETVEYGFAVQNAGPSKALHTAVSGFLPAPLRVVSSPDGCVAVGQRISCPPVESLAAGKRVEHRIAVRLDPRYAGDGGDLAVWATARSYSTDPDRADNTVTRYR